MKKTSKAASSNKPVTHTIRIEFQDEQAHEVCIAGSFNDWRPDVTPMLKLGVGRWAKDLTLPPGRYEYRLVVDGEWHTDPSAGECVPNGLGSLNCVLNVPPVDGDQANGEQKGGSRQNG